MCKSSAYKSLSLIFLAGLVHGRCTTTYEVKCDSAEDLGVEGDSSWTSVTVDCVNCRKTVLTSAAFAKLPNLEDVNIVGALGDLGEAPFAGLKRLQQVALYGNDLNVLPGESFANIAALKKLVLKSNGVLAISPGAFGGSPIETLDLSQNNLSSINAGAFQVASLSRLALAFNSISEIAELSFHENLTELDLSHNKLRFLALGVLNNLVNLKRLSLSHNQIRSITAFPRVTQLEHLNLAHNDIELLEDSSLASQVKLDTLNLNDNKIAFLNPRAFPETSNLQTLYLHKNRMTFVPGELGGVLMNLKRMSIGGNPWVCPCLDVVETFVKSRGVALVECDRKFFHGGGNAVCLLTDSERCTGNEAEGILKERLQDATNLINSYKC